MEQLQPQLTAVLVIIAGLMITPLAFVMLDYWSGIRKAHKRGEAIKSDKMKRTVDKIARYYNAILAMLVVDLVQMASFVFMSMFYGWTAYTIPIFTVIAVLFVAAIEIKSICEPADVKESREMKEVTLLAKAITEHKNDPKAIAEAITEYLNIK